MVNHHGDHCLAKISMGNANHRRFFNDFLNHITKQDAALSGKFGLSWESVSDAVLGDKEIWAHFATFLVEVYKIPAGLINAGKSPGKGTAVNAWSGMINQARTRTLDSEELESILVAALPSLGAERKLGTAPRSGQEREVQRLLDRLKD